ncbi:uncharacterized protein LACBIDRAFT_333832 [Laccaria bicolor S238N-H82]|uniref:Predicted protein n=1 Tax=Laccaria bicolor (strain S238N-H82 / ATCC MYA-4686) TaxID=486041 RepID=B0DX80_LACBS|nr:uncharacterized protein LACBIDRAFT_333832 [Laccaria bicolor S238N-H82]EDR00746.1 predicted protein [Laccaria bicolor S238N-H82]|eukprot:XP_001888538.1 predicted protein [Laccaria bicolor S238N-H82]
MPTGDGAHKFENITGQASLDGQGGTEPPSQTISASEHRNIYYRLYTKGGPLESNNPIFSNDRSISRISSKSVRPPRTATSLKRYICKIEGVEGPEKSALYLSQSEKKPVDDSARLALRGDSGPGSSEVDPVVLVVDKGAAKKRPRAASHAGSNELPTWKIERCYGALYYRFYDDDGEAVSKTSFDESDSSLGHVDIFIIPPPHTVASLKECLIHVEGVLGHDIQLLENEDGEVTLNDGNVIALLTDNCPGSKEGQPIVFTYSRKGSDKTTAPETRPSFSKCLTAKHDWDGASYDAAWHSVVAGEILQTDGVAMNKKFSSSGVLERKLLFTTSFEISLGYVQKFHRLILLITGEKPES